VIGAEVSILRDERLLALHDLVSACRASSSHCEQAAELLAKDPKAGGLKALAQRRREAADFFGERMVEADDIPEGQPEELSLLQTVLARAKTAFAHDGGAALLEVCRVQEEEVEKCARAAAGTELGQAEQAAADALARDARSQLDSLLKP